MRKNRVLTRLIQTDVLIPALLFLVSLIINLVYLNWSKSPVIFPDSRDYLTFASDVQTLSFPDTTLRTPVYPLYLLLFTGLGHLRWAVYSQVIIGALSVCILYLLACQISKNRLISFLVSALVALDYGIASFQATILTETLSVFLVLLFVYLHLVLFDKIDRLSIAVLVIIDACLVFVRPVFLVLPISVYLFKALYVIYFESGPLIRKKILACTLAVILNLTLIAGYSGMNYLKYGYFGFSVVSDLNTFGKVLQYRYLDQVDTGDAPPIVNKVVQVYRQSGRERNPSILMRRLINKGISKGPYDKDVLKPVNSYVLKGRYGDFVAQSYSLLLMNFGIQDSVYVPPNDSLKKSQAFAGLTDFFNNLSRYFIFGFLVNLIAGIYLFFRKKKNSRKYLLMSIVILYTMVFITAFSYGEYSRLREPIRFLLELCIFLPISFCLNKLTIGFKNIKKLS